MDYDQFWFVCVGDMSHETMHVRESTVNVPPALFNVTNAEITAFALHWIMRIIELAFKFSYWEMLKRYVLINFDQSINYGLGDGVAVIRGMSKCFIGYFLLTPWVFITDSRCAASPCSKPEKWIFKFRRKPQVSKESKCIWLLGNCA